MAVQKPMGDVMDPTPAPFTQSMAVTLLSHRYEARGLMNDFLFFKLDSQQENLSKPFSVQLLIQSPYNFQTWWLTCLDDIMKDSVKQL